MEFVIIGFVKDEKEELKEKIKKMGGKVVTKISRSVMAVIARESDVENLGSRMEQARVEDVHVVSKDFVDEAKDNTGKIPDLIIKKNICQWGSDVRKYCFPCALYLKVILIFSLRCVFHQKHQKVENLNRVAFLQAMYLVSRN